MGDDRRRYARATINLDVEVDAVGTQWSGKTVDLSPYGVKVALRGRSVAVPSGADARVLLVLDERKAPLSLPAKVVRAGSDGMALDFVGLDEEQFERLKRFVDALLQQEWEQMMKGIATAQPRDAGAAPAPPQPSDNGSDKAHWQALLKRLGLETLQLPSGGTLTGQWKEFLEQLEARESGVRKPRKGTGQPQ